LSKEEEEEKILKELEKAVRNFKLEAEKSKPVRRKKKVFNPSRRDS